MLSAFPASYATFATQVAGVTSALLGGDGADRFLTALADPRHNNSFDTFCECCADGTASVLALCERSSRSTIESTAPPGAPSIELFLGVEALFQACDAQRLVGAETAPSTALDPETTVVLFISRAVPTAAAPSEASATPASSDPPTTAAPAAAHRHLSLRDVTVRTINVKTAADVLSRELAHVFGPLCRQNRVLASSIADLSSAMTSHTALLKEFRISNYLHPDVTAALAAAGSGAAADTVVALLLARPTANDLVQELLRLRNRCTEELENSMKQLDPPVRSFREEVSFWQSVTRWAEDVQGHLNGREWDLQTRILVEKRRVQLRNASSNERLNEMVRQAKEKTDFLAAVPHASVVQCTNIEQLKLAVTRTFEKLGEATMGKFPVRRVVGLGWTVIADVCGKVAALAQDVTLMRPTAEARAWLECAREAVREAWQGGNALQRLHSSAAMQQRFGVRPTHDAGSMHLGATGGTQPAEALDKRIEQVLALIDSHTVMQKGLSHLMGQHGLSSVALVEKLDHALVELGSFQHCLFDLADARQTEFAAALDRYQESLAAIDAIVVECIRSRLATAVAAPEMYRLHRTFQQLIMRPAVRAALEQFQAPLLQLIDAGIREAKTRYLNYGAAKEAVRLTVARGLSPTVARVVWELTTARRIDDMMKRHGEVSDLGWTRLMTLLNSDGRWLLNEALASAIGVGLSDLERVQWITPDSGQSGNVNVRTVMSARSSSTYGTAYALAFMEQVHNREEDAIEWKAATASQRQYLRTVQDDTKINYLQLAKARLDDIGVGQRQHAYHQYIAEHGKFTRNIQEKIDACVQEWQSQAEAVMRQAADAEVYRPDSSMLNGTIFTTRRMGMDNKQAPTIVINFPLAAARYIRDRKELASLGLPRQHAGVPHSSSNMALLQHFFDTCEPHVPTAITIQELLNTYYESARFATHSLNTLLIQEHNAVQNALLQGAALTWGHHDVRVFTRLAAQAISQYSYSVDQLRVVSSQVAVSIDALAPTLLAGGDAGEGVDSHSRSTGGPSATATWQLATFDDLKQRLESLQALINSVAVMCPATVAAWVPTLMPSISRHLSSHLEHLLAEWTAEFSLLDPQRRAALLEGYGSDLSSSGDSNQAKSLATVPGLRRHFGLTNLSVGIKVSQQQVRLEPSLVACRRFWYCKLNEAVSTVVELPPLRSFAGELDSIVPDHQGGGAHAAAQFGFHYLIETLGSQVFEHAFEAVEAALQRLQVQLEQWRRHQMLWEMELDVLFNNLGTNIEAWASLVAEIRTKAKAMMDSSETTVVSVGFSIDADAAQRSVAAKFQQMAAAILNRFKEVLGIRMCGLNDVLCAERQKVEDSKVGQSTQDALQFLSALPALRLQLAEWTTSVSKCVQAQELVHERGSLHSASSLPKKWISSESLQAALDSLNTIVARRVAVVESRRSELHEEVEASVRRQMELVGKLDGEFRAAALDRGALLPPLARLEVNRFFKETTRLTEEYISVMRSQEALGMEPVKIMTLDALHSDVGGLKTVLDAVCTVHDELEKLCERRFAESSPRQLLLDFKGLEGKLVGFPGSMRSFVVYQAVLTQVRKCVTVSPLLGELRSDAMNHERHWTALRLSLKKGPTFTLNEVKIAEVLAADLSANDKVIRDVIRHAQGEMALETFLSSIRKCWEEYCLDVVLFQGKVSLVRGWEAMDEKLAEHLSALQSMKLSPYFKEFELSVKDWTEKLERASAVLTALADVQRRWVYLSGVFGSSEDVKYQLGDALVKFNAANTEFLAVMSKANSATTVLRFTSTEKLNAKLETIGNLLVNVQNRLGEYLESQRASFARFYFVGDDDLLDIIGNGKNPVLVAKHLRKMFAGIGALQVMAPAGDAGSQAIHAVASCEGEVLSLVTAVEASGMKVNDWLAGLEASVIGTLQCLVKKAVATYPAAADDSLIGWVAGLPNQISCLASQVAFTQSVDALLAKGEGTSPALASMTATLERLSRHILTPNIDSFLRVKIEQLITVAVYQRDVARGLVLCKNKSHFDWIQRLRCYEVAAKDGGGDGGVAGGKPIVPAAAQRSGVSIRMADAEFAHSFEYLGLTERLVQTPLTDKCFLTLTQALHTKLGGSPSGPAGTGKTETVKALGNQLGRFTLVFNCDEAFDFKSMGRIFVGLCQVGAWGCFDEFNRLEERILSAVSQQIQCIQEGLKAGAERVSLVDRTVPVHRNVGVFITMNPGYAGRSNLPDNLKQLFRSVAMASPDREAIAEVTLFAQGFQSAQVLSRKVVPLFKLCKDQLSPQQHYDFGLRALNSVLVSAGSLKRLASAKGRQELSDAEESDLVIQSLTETVIPKLVAEDTALFSALLKDVFPSYKQPTDELQDLKEAVLRRCAERRLVASESWLTKIMQLYKIMGVNHGVMLVGPSGTGKTTAWKTLIHAIADCEDVDCHAHVIDPKAVSKADLFGTLDQTTREWKDGVFTATLRQIIDEIAMAESDQQQQQQGQGEASKRSGGAKRHWIIFDGDVDPEWVENLNSLLDDNRLFTLPNGERLALPPTVRIVFEVADLRYATLATVSRCGMVWFSNGTLPVSAVICNAFQDLCARPLTSLEDFDPCATVERRTTRKAALAKKVATGSAEYGPEQLALLAFQKEALQHIAAEFEPGALVERAVQVAENRLSKCVIMEMNELQAVRSLMGLLAAGVEHLYTQRELGKSYTEQQQATYMRRRLAFAVVWGLASMCSLEDRKAFAEELIKARLVPDSPPAVGGSLVSIIDSDVSAEDAQWVSWASRGPPTEINANRVGANDLVIATVDTVRHEEIIASWLRTGKPVILCGPPGSGKTMSLTAVLRNAPEYECAFLNFSSQTAPSTVIKLLEQYTVYKPTIHGLVLTPRSAGKKLIIFCDEINLPTPDKYGTQAVVQLIRQLCERRGFYRAKDNAWISLENITFAGACNPPTDPGRTPMSPRLLRWAPVLFVDFPSKDSLLQIYTTYCRAVLKRNPRVRNQAPNLAIGMVEFYLASQKRFTPDQQRHYVYSPRELSRWSRAIHEGLLTLDDTAQVNVQTEHLVRLAVHEGLRLFRDRLVTSDAEKWTDVEIDRCFMDAFPGISSQCLDRPILFSTICTRDYASVSLDELRRDIQGKFKAFAEEELDVQIVVFDAVVEHVVRLHRVLRQPLGHLLLVGASGVGKTVLAKFVSWLGGMTPFQIKVHRHYTLQDFEEDLRVVMRRAGCKREKICFIFDESNVMDSGFLEYMNALLASGDVPGLFDGEEWATLMHQIRDAVSQQGNGSTSGSRGTAAAGGSADSYVDVTVESELYKWFISQVSVNLHVVFTMNPHSSDFSNRSATSPALFNRCTIDWFGDWTQDTLKQVARELTARVDLMDVDPGRFADLDEAQHCISSTFVRIHDIASNINQRLRLKAANRGSFITPRHYLDFICHFLTLVKEKRESTNELQRHLNGGLGKLRETAATVTQQQQRLSEKEKVLAEAQRRAQDMLSQIVVETQNAEKGKKDSSELAETLQIEGKRISEQRQQAETQLATVQPMLDAAAAALSTVKAEYLSEIRAYASPPPAVRKVLEAVCFVLGEKKAPDWDTIKNILRRDLLQQVRAFRPTDLTDDARDKIKKGYMSDEMFTPENANRSSKAAGPLVQWVIAQVKYGEIHSQIKPLQDNIEKLTRVHDEKAAALDVARRHVQQNEEAIGRLKDQYTTMMEETSRIKSEISVVSARCHRATALMTNLSSERIRWEEQSQSFRVQMSAVVGDCIISSAFLAYIGHFDEQTRTHSLIREWKDAVDDARVSLRMQLSVADFLSRPDQRAGWLANKLPQDNLCVENAVILNRYRRYPLVIDPSGQAAEFLENELKSRNVRKTSFLDKNFMKILEQCVRFGHAALIQDAEHVDPVLNPLLNKEIRRTGGRLLVRLGAQEIDVGPNFSMVLVTRDSTQQFSPDLCGRVSLVNFTVTPGTMTSQTLHKILIHERQDVEEKRSSLIKLQGEYALRQRTLEDQLLVAISDSQGNILENETLIATLETLKAESAVVKEQMESSEAAYSEIKAVESKYLPFSTTVSRLFFALSQLPELNAMYHLSSRNMFFDAVQSALEGVAAAGAPGAAMSPDARLPLIVRTVFLRMNHRITRSMFECDHMAFLLRLAQLRLDLGDDVARSCPPDLFSLILPTTVAVKGTKEVLLPGSLREKLGSTTADSFCSALSSPCLSRIADHVAHNEPTWTAFALNPTLTLSDFPKECLLNQPTSQLADAIALAVVVKCLRPAAFSAALEAVFSSVFDHDAKGNKLPGADTAPFLSRSHLQDIAAVMPELDPFTPLMLINSRGFDASVKFEALARATSGGGLSVVAMGSPEGVNQADQYISAAMRDGSWVLLKNVHLSGAAFLATIEKRLHAERYNAKCHAGFRLALATEVSSVVPANLVRSARAVTFEPPPGVKSNLQRTLCAMSSHSVPAAPLELPRILFVASWCHAVIMERLRYVPLGWSKRYEFSDAEFYRTTATIVAWTVQAAGGRTNIPPRDIPWSAITQLVSQTIYGGKIDNPFDGCVLESFINSLLSPAMFEGSFSLVAGSKVNCDEGATLGDFQEWVRKLPEVESPEWLGLPATATQMVLAADAVQSLRKLSSIQSATDDVADDNASPPRGGVAAVAAGGRDVAAGVRQAQTATAAPVVAWIQKLKPTVSRFRGLIAGCATQAASLKSKTDGKGSGCSVAAPVVDPILLTLEREAALGAFLFKTIAADLDALHGLCEGTVKASNDHRRLVDAFLRDAVPASWKKYPVATSVPLSAWFIDFIGRLEHVTALCASAAAPTVLRLGSLFFPGGFITATRQAVARRTNVALEQLELHVAMALAAASSGGTPAVTSSSDAEGRFLLAGLHLHGAGCGSDGSLVIPSSESARSSTVIDLSIRWIPAASSAEAATIPATSAGRKDFPMYLDDTRSDALCVCKLPVGASADSSDRWYQRGVCLTASITA
mgnify:CR=1 FL=1